MNYALEEIEEENNIVEFKKQKSFTYTVHKLNKIAHLFNQQEHQIALVELFINTASDRELYDLVISLTQKVLGYDHNGQPVIENLPIAYPKGFSREFAIGIIDKLKVEQPERVANYGLNLLVGWNKECKDIGFVLKNNNSIHCFFAMGEDEPNHSLYFQLALRGTEIEKARAAVSFLRLWHNGYLRYWFDQGYRYIWANSFTPKGKEFINQAGAKENKHIFFSRQANKTVRWNSVYHWLSDARWDLKKKFERKNDKIQG